MVNPFTLPGSFLRGNLHTHTTVSDGELTPQESVDLYRRNGYDFLAITDHNRLVVPSTVKADGITLLPGMELHQGKGELGQTHHIVAIGMETPIEVPETTSLQTALSFISSRCRFAFIAHPYWTSVTYRDILGARSHIGIEVYNHTCECGIGRGDSGETWDQLLARGERLLGFAVDDTHGHYADSLGGWIMLKTGGNTAEAIISAIMSGAFYSSSGPTIEDVSFEGNQVTVRCSPCQAVHVISPRPGSGNTTRRQGLDSGPYTTVTLGMDVQWAPVRIECVDERGRKAWTNPFWFD
jgi:hypothetical protein